MTHKKTDRFHITCLWCRTRRNRKLTRHIRYAYLSLPWTATWAYQIDHEHKKIYRFPIKVPQILMIDPAGHFTNLRCFCIVAFDKLMLKFRLKGRLLHVCANVCEFFANYPTV